MMRKIMSNSSGHGMSDRKFPESSDFICTSCATGEINFETITSQNTG
jgi:hypothetical protein